MENRLLNSKTGEDKLSSLEQEKIIANRKVQEIEQSLEKAKQLNHEINSEYDYAKRSEPATNKTTQQAPTISAQTVSQKQNGVQSFERNSNPEEQYQQKSYKAPRQQEVYEEEDSHEEEPVRVVPKPRVKQVEAPASKKSSKAKNNPVDDIEDIKEEIKNYAYSTKVRSKGKFAAKEVNKTKKSTNEVFIYLVDDNAKQLKALQDKFKASRAYKTTKAFDSGDKCFKYIQSRKYGKNSVIVVIADYYMQSQAKRGMMNGLDLLVSLKEYDPCIDVILISDYDDQELADTAFHYGAVGFVKKGVAASRTILTEIQSIAKKREAIRKKASGKGAKKFFLVLLILAIVTLGTLVGLDATIMKGKFKLAFWIQPEVPVQVQQTNVPEEGTEAVEGADAVKTETPKAEAEKTATPASDSHTAE